MEIVIAIVLLLLTIPSTLASTVLLAKPNCQENCGNIAIPFPFGIGSKCSIDTQFEIACDNSTSPPRPFLKQINLEVLNISVYDSRGTGNYLTVRGPVSFFNCIGRKNQEVNFSGTPFQVSSRNTFVALSCDAQATLDLSRGSVFLATGCVSTCSSNGSVTAARPLCNDIDCCEAQIPISSLTNSYKISINGSSSSTSNDECKSAFLIEEEYWSRYKYNMSLEQVRNMDFVPLSLQWTLNYSYFDVFKTHEINRKTTFCYNGFDSSNGAYLDTTAVVPLLCSCSGFRGNPYLINGCSQDINECEEFNACDKGATCVNTHGSYRCSYHQRYIFIGIGSALGALLLLFGIWGLYKLIKKRKESKLKKMFFKQNGGLLLQQQLLSDGGNIKKTMLFTSSDLSKATDHFSIERVLGQGGQGTVYKGMLEDGKIVAIKKSKVVDKEKLSEFINEVVILSQINHRNVVQLLGCCLETEVPILVYEFVPNGTLSNYIHVRNEDFPFTWKMRLRIAAEVAGALSYLHSAASFPIYHRDVKTSNILLDEKYKAKVADFGTSRTISIEQSHLTTFVNGTFGYLDPEYFQSSQFTDKSDVYSFGVVLVELLTGQKAISAIRTEEGRNLAMYFTMSMEGNALFDTVDTLVLEDGSRDEIMFVARLALKCLSSNGRNRPTMKEVSTELERVQKLEKSESIRDAKKKYDAIGFDGTEFISRWDSASPSTGSTLDSTNCSSTLQELPLLSFEPR